MHTVPPNVQSNFLFIPKAFLDWFDSGEDLYSPKKKPQN